MPDIGPLELIIIVVIALLVFGPGRIGDVGVALGRGMREFRKNMNEDAPAQSAKSRAGAGAGVSVVCSACGQTNAERAKFCASCGTRLAAW